MAFVEEQLGRATLAALRWVAARRVGARWRQATDSRGRVTHLLSSGPERAPAVVWLHGFADRPESILPTVAQSTASLRWIAPGLPGFVRGWVDPAFRHRPEDYAGWLTELLEAEAPDEPVVLVGNSLGGAVALAAAAAAPDRVRGVVALNAAGVQVQGADSLVEEVQGGYNPFAIRVPEDYQQLMVRLFPRPPWMPRPVRSHLFRQFHEQADWYVRIMDDLSAVEVVEQGGAWTSGLRLSTIAAPTLVLWGTEDTFFPLAHAEAFVDGIREARLQPLPGIGHCAHLQRPATLAGAVDAFVTSLPVQG
ncbi:MAG: alpha/beta hydrolase [Myxococcales bacterium]|nr:alpha/beta hydrolase [Myxococcales bacterium]